MQKFCTYFLVCSLYPTNGARWQRYVSPKQYIYSLHGLHHVLEKELNCAFTDQRSSLNRTHHLYFQGPECLLTPCGYYWLQAIKSYSAWIDLMFQKLVSLPPFILPFIPPSLTVLYSFISLLHNVISSVKSNLTDLRRQQPACPPMCVFIRKSKNFDQFS
jgi:hypothetical protein